jgi:hypothetical protein
VRLLRNYELQTYAPFMVKAVTAIASERTSRLQELPSSLIEVVLRILLGDVDLKATGGEDPDLAASSPST